MLIKYKKIELLLGAVFLAFSVWMFLSYRELKKENTVLRAKNQESENATQKVPSPPKEASTSVKKIALEETDYFYEPQAQKSSSSSASSTLKETTETKSLPLPPADFEKTRMATGASLSSLESETSLGNKTEETATKTESLATGSSNNSSATSSKNSSATSSATKTSSSDSDSDFFTFAVIGDSENLKNYSGYNPELVTILGEVQELKPDFTIFSGDMISAADESNVTNERKINDLKEKIDENLSKYFLVLGKHDLDCGNFCVDTWRKVFWGEDKPEDGKRKLYHSFNYQNAHFILLSNDYPLRRSLDRDQLIWLEDDLRKTKQEHKIVVMHVPPITFFEESKKDCHDMSCEKEVQKEVLALFREYDVDLVISGHEHTFDYKKESDINYVLSGNSGNEDRYEGALDGDFFTFFKIKGDEIELQAFTKEGKIAKEAQIK